MHHRSDNDLSWEASERRNPIHKQTYENNYKEKFSPLLFVKTLKTQIL